jgi:hypothetical protein
MIEHLARRLEDFPGDPNRARCFTHILNLVVKTIMHQFEVPQKWRRWDSHSDDITRDLLDLAGDIDVEEEETEAEQEDGSEDGRGHDNNEDWIDERGNMITEEIDELEAHVRPVTVVLTKVNLTKSCIVLANPLTRLRFGNLRMQSKTQALLPFLSGTASSRTSRLRHG